MKCMGNWALLFATCMVDGSICNIGERMDNHRRILGYLCVCAHVNIFICLYVCVCVPGVLWHAVQQWDEGPNSKELQ